MLLAARSSLSRCARSIAGAKALIRRDDGAAAVEFALVAAPFIALLFALVEAMVIFFAGRCSTWPSPRRAGRS